MKHYHYIRGAVALALGLGLLSATTAQTVTRDQSGNFQEVPRTQAAQHDSTTTFTYTTKEGATKPVYQGAKGGMYVWAVSSKTGKPYRKYLKVQGSDDNGPKLAEQ